MIPDKIYFEHVRYDGPCGYTVAWKMSAGGYDPQRYFFHIGIANCGPHDNFNKKIGRAISEGRLRTMMSREPTPKWAIRRQIPESLAKSGGRETLRREVLILAELRIGENLSPTWRG